MLLHHLPDDPISPGVGPANVIVLVPLGLAGGVPGGVLSGPEGLVDDPYWHCGRQQCLQGFVANYLEDLRFSNISVYAHWLLIVVWCQDHPCCGPQSLAHPVPCVY